jgi:hypothetical protein
MELCCLLAISQVKNQMDKTSMKIILLIFVSILISSINSLYAKELPLVLDKPGAFEILSRTDYTSPECGFTRADTTTNLQRITDLVNTIRQNPVLNDMKGFNGRARIYNVTCTDVDSYGVPSRISFEFSSFFLSTKGEVTWRKDEPPQWSIYINKPNPVGYGFSSGSFNSRHGYFTVPLKKETLEPGIDVYDGECFVIYDPSRAAYWIPVTVNEAFATVREENQNDKDRVAAEYMKKYIEKEYSEIPEADRDKPAYYGGNLSRVSSQPGALEMENIFPCIMKVNPEYWDKSLPKSAIQFISFRSIPHKEYLKKLKEEYLQNNSTSYHLKLFEESFGMDDIRRLVPLIGR